LSSPNEQIDCTSLTLNLQKLFSDLKNFIGNILDQLSFNNSIKSTYNDFGFFGGFSESIICVDSLSLIFLWTALNENTCTVPRSEEHARKWELELKHILYISLFFVPLLTSWRYSPSNALKILINVPFLKFKNVLDDLPLLINYHLSSMQHWLFLTREHLLNLIFAYRNFLRVHGLGFYLDML